MESECIPSTHYWCKVCIFFSNHQGKYSLLEIHALYEQFEKEYFENQYNPVASRKLLELIWTEGDRFDDIFKNLFVQVQT